MKPERRERFKGIDPRHRRTVQRVSERYSVFVGMMRFLLPAIAAALLGLVVIWPLVTGKNEGFRLTFAPAEHEDAGPLKMANARYMGVDDHDQAYTITADLAVQQASDSDLIELHGPKADINLADDSWLALTASRGFYHRMRETIDLVGAVNAFSDSGFEMRTESARIDLANGLAEGYEPVVGQGPLGTLNAEGFRLLDNGQRVLFTGPVKLILYPGNGEETR